MQIHPHEQRSEEWYKARIGLPTASMFKTLVTPTGKPSTQYVGYACSLANELYAHESELDGFSGNSWTERGEITEAEAIKWYEFTRDTTVESVGLITENGEGWDAGCSPDGLLGKNGMLEVKCLKAEHHTKALWEYDKTGAPPSDFGIQVQGQMLISGRKWVDLLLYHPKLPKLLVRMTPDAERIGLLKKQLTAVCTERDAILHALRKHAGES